MIIACRDCQHIDEIVPQGECPQCNAPENLKEMPHYLDGTTRFVRLWDCLAARGDNELCGHNARWFLAKEANHRIHACKESNRELGWRCASCGTFERLMPYSKAEVA